VPIFVVAYYIILEGYKKEDLYTSDFGLYFLELTVFWHFYSRIMRSGFECSKKDWCKPPLFLVWLGAIFLFKIVWIIWFALDIDRNVYWRRLLFELTYGLMQIINGTNLGEMSQDFWFFCADVLIGTQLYTVFFRDEVNFSVVNSFTPILLSLLTFLLVRGLLVNNRDKDIPCMVKTIGKHDAIFLILVYAFVSFTMYCIDFFANTYYAALGFVYVLHNIIIFPSLMESKLVVPLVTSGIFVLLVTGLQLFIMDNTTNPYPRPVEVGPDNYMEVPNSIMGYVAGLIETQLAAY
jgi:hypothetical protein